LGSKFVHLKNAGHINVEAGFGPWPLGLALEVLVSFRKAMVSSGKVAAIKNASGQSIAVSVKIERGSSGVGRAYELTLDPGQAREIGER
jgi:Serine hydrolase